MIVAVDLSTVVVLAAISLSEGIGRLPGGALVLRRTLVGPWRVGETVVRPGRLRLVQCWPPLLEALVIPGGGDAAPRLNRADLQRRLASITQVRHAARALGAITLIGLVLGIPLGLGIAGWVGGLLALAGVVTGQIGLAAIGWRGLRLLGTDRRVCWRLVAVTLNPFAAPSVATRILVAAVAGASPLTVARTLLPPATWAAWFRRRAYDARVARIPDEDLSRDLEDANEAIDAVLGQKPQAGGDDGWCPRCGDTYQAGFTTCAECEVPLEGAGASASRNSKC
jgi:hypothetical protein